MASTLRMTSYNWLRLRSLRWGVRTNSGIGSIRNLSSVLTGTLGRSKNLHGSARTLSGFKEKRTFCRVTDSRSTDLYMEEIFEAGVGEEDPFDDYRNILYPSEINSISEESKLEDPLYRLCYASSMSEVLDIIDSLGDEVSPMQSSQALSTLFHIQKFAAYVVDYLDETDYLECRAEFNRTLREQERYIRLVEMIRNHMCDMPLHVSSYLFMCLRRMEQPLTNSIMQDFVIHLRRHFGDMDATALSYFCVGLRGRNLYKSRLKETPIMWHLTLAPAIPKVREMIETMKNHEDAKKIAIILNATSKLISANLMDEFMQKVVCMIEAGEFDSDASLSSLVKILSLYISIRDWHLDKAHITRTIMYAFRNRTHLLRPIQALIVSKVALDTFEPVSIFYEIDKTITAMFQREKMYQTTSSTSPTTSSSDNGPSPSKDVQYCNFLPRIDFLQAIVNANVARLPRKKIEPIFLEHMNGPGFKFSVSQLFEIIRSSSVGTSKIVGDYLDRTLDVCRNDLTDLSRLALRYLNFNSLQGGSKRHEPFEENLCQIFLEDILETPFPGRFAIELGFLIAYADDIPDQVIERFHQLLGQLNAFAIYSVCRGIEVRYFYWTYFSKDSKSAQNYPQKGKAEIKQKLEEIQLALESRTQEILQNDCHEFAQAYTLFRTYLCRSKHLPLEEFAKVIEDIFLEKFHKAPLSFTVIRQICLALKNARPVYGVPDLIEKILEHVFPLRSHVHSITLVHLLNLCYLVNHDIKNLNFLDICSFCIIRDFDSLAGFYILETSVALAKYQALKFELASKIFSPEFMDRLDAEISSSTLAYANRVRKTMMEFNRTVCLQYPEFKVPWFHEKYCQEEANSAFSQYAHSTMPSHFINNTSRYQLREDVYQNLSSSIGGDRFFRENVFSPYYNHIDFEVWQDESGSFAPLGDISSNFSLLRRSTDSAQQGTKWQKFAVIVNLEGDYTQDTKRPVGVVDLCEKNLQLQNYTVITINPFAWNAMQMSEPDAKCNFFKTKFNVLKDTQPKFPFSASGSDT